MAKVTLEDVKRRVDDAGHKLLSKEYVSARSKLLMECPLGHRFERSLNSLDYFKRCPQCLEETGYRGASQRLTHEQVLLRFQEQGFTILAGQYVNNKSKFLVRCANGHEFNTVVSSLAGCSKCNLESKQSKGLLKAKEYLQQSGYELLSNFYVNSQTHLTVKCPDNHVYQTTYRNFATGKRCKKCSMKESGAKRRQSIDQIRQVIESAGYQLLSETYESKVKIEIMCPKGHLTKTLIDSFKKGHRCAVCAGNAAFSFEFVKGEIEKAGYSLLSSTYEDVNSKLLIRCDKGHQVKMTFASFRAGCRCNQCSKNKVFTLEEVKEYIESNGYYLLSSAYKNRKEKLAIQCPNEHLLKMSFGGFKAGNRCAKCRGIEDLNFESVRKYFESVGYQLKSHEYFNAHQLLLVACPEGHEFQCKFSNFKFNNRRCPDCFKNKNRGENHPQWNPSLTSEDRAKRRTVEGYKDWRSAVFERDDYTCQCCKAKNSVYLNAHHLYGYAAYPELRMSIENGITLCRACHRNFHSAFGTKNNTKEQFELFLSKELSKK